MGHPAFCVCDRMAGMNFWLIIRLLKDAVLIIGGVAAIVVIYRKAKHVG